MLYISLHKHMQSWFMRCETCSVIDFTILHTRRTASFRNGSHYDTVLLLKIQISYTAVDNYISKLSDTADGNTRLLTYMCPTSLEHIIKPSLTFPFIPIEVTNTKHIPNFSPASTLAETDGLTQ